MLRWVLVVALCAFGTSCKVVHSTAGADADTGDKLLVGFIRGDTNIYEGANIAVFVNMTAPVGRPVTVTLLVSDITATLGKDYTVASRSVRFAPGETMVPIGVTILTDDDAEANETFALEITSADGVEVIRDRHVVTISSNAFPYVGFDTFDQIVDEDVSRTIGISLSEPSNLRITVAIDVGGTATSADHQLVPGSIIFEPGSVSEMIHLGVFDDAFDEPNETVIVTLPHADHAQLGALAVHTYTIRDDDLPPSVTFESYTQAIGEGDLGTLSVSARVRLSVPSAQTVTVPFSINAASTATADVDYRLHTASPLTFTPGTTTATISMTVISDKTVEGNEHVNIQLQLPTNASLGLVNQHALVIANDDCLGTGAFAVCPAAPLADAVVLPPDLSTDASSYCTSQQPARWLQNGQHPACVVFARSITVNTTVARGSRALVLAATESITITNLLDVSAERDFMAAGAGYAPCGPPLALPGPNAGGAGGSFMTSGASGGSHQNPAGSGGIAAPAEAQPPTLLRAGCDGQMGADNFAASGPGRGGGAVYLVAGGSITLQPGAAIDASGAGGVGSADLSSGGSGGGSGGMITLVAQAIGASMAYLAANGGGGAEGGTATTAGTDGGNPTPTAPLVQAQGGSGTSGGDGGNGFAQGLPATSGSSATNNNGAGGGGGGAGYIVANQPLTGAVVSPAP